QRRHAIQVLGEIGPAAKSAIPALGGLAKDSSAWLRQAAALALGRIGDADAVPALMRFLEDEIWCVRAEAAVALGKLGPAANAVAMLCAVAPDAVEDFATPLALVRQALAALDRTALPADERQRLRHAWLNTEGAVLYRAGDHREAVARLKEAVAYHGGDGTPE